MNEFNVPPRRAGATPAKRRGTTSRASNPGVEPAPPARASDATTARTGTNPASKPTAARAARPASADQYPTTNKENAMQCSTKTKTGMTILGSAGIGAVLMYLLDPEQGERRRAEAADATRRAAEHTGAALAASYEVAKEKGQSLGETLGEYGTAGAESAGTLGSRLLGRASDAGRSLGKTSRQYAQSARDGIGTPRSWLGREEQRSYVPSTGSTLSAVACLAAGFGLMYLMDPQQGRRRRAVARDKTVSWLNEIGDFSRKTGRHLVNKSRGYAHETMKATRGMAGGMMGGEGSGLSLAERIRSRIGALGRGKNVNVECDDCGAVTLGGDCAPDEVEILVAEIQAIPGVDSVDNRMNVRDGTAAGFGQ